MTAYDSAGAAPLGSSGRGAARAAPLGLQKAADSDLGA
jgi:hypothetical protein